MRNKYLLFAFLSCLCLSLNAQMTFWSDGSIGLLQKVNNNGAAAGSTIYDFTSNTYVPAFKVSGSWMSIDSVTGVEEPVEVCNNTDVTTIDVAAVTSVINVAESGTIGTDATLDAVVIDIMHTWANDLEIVLVSPSGTEVALSTDNGGSSGLDTQAILTFTDSAADHSGAWNSGAPAASYRAEGGPTAHPVADSDDIGVNMNDEFAGESITGDWTLRVYDDTAADTGTVYNFCLNFMVEASETEGCLEANPTLPQWPTATFTPACIGTAQPIAANCWTGEYSMVQVTAGTEYTFSSSVTTDMVTISDETGTTIYAAGVSSVTWTATTDELIRFYLHLDEDCTWGDQVNRSRLVQCGEVAPPPANDDCSGVTPTVLTNGVPVTFNGTTEGATQSPDETAVVGFTAVWEAVTLTGECNNLTVDYCGTSLDVMDSFSTIYTLGCPSTSWVAGTNDQTTCGDGNGTIRFFNLPAGTYYLPVVADLDYNTALGDYTMNVIVEECFLIEEPDFDCFQGDGLEGNSEESYNISAAMSFRTADDFTVTDDTTMSIQQISLSIMAPSEITSVDFNILNDNSGHPGSVNQTLTGILPTEQNISGTSFGLYRYWVVFDLPTPIDLEAGTYWLNPIATTADNSPEIYWEITSTGTTGNAYHLSSDSGATWTADADGGNTVFFVAGECEELGVSDINSFNFTYYPNPVKNYLTIDAMKNIEDISVHNMAGQSVLQGVKAVDGKVNMSNLPPGVYVFRVTLEGGQVETFKVIKK